MSIYSENRKKNARLDLQYKWYVQT